MISPFRCRRLFKIVVAGLKCLECSLLRSCILNDDEGSTEERTGDRNEHLKLGSNTIERQRMRHTFQISRVFFSEEVCGILFTYHSNLIESSLENRIHHL